MWYFLSFAFSHSASFFLCIVFFRLFWSHIYDLFFLWFDFLGIFYFSFTFFTPHWFWIDLTHLNLTLLFLICLRLPSLHFIYHHLTLLDLTWPYLTWLCLANPDQALREVTWHTATWRNGTLFRYTSLHYSSHLENWELTKLHGTWLNVSLRCTWQNEPCLTQLDVTWRTVQQCNVTELNLPSLSVTECSVT